MVSQCFLKPSLNCVVRLLGKRGFEAELTVQSCRDGFALALIHLPK